MTKMNIDGNQCFATVSLLNKMIFSISLDDNARYQPSLKEMLQRIDQQAKQNRQKREEYEKTAKLLRLVDKDKER